MKMKGFKNVNIYVENEGIIKTSLTIKDDKIYEIGNNLEVEPLLLCDEEILVVPGFIDEHIHGANGSDCMDATFQDLENIAVKIAEEGVTSFFTTTMTQKKENICQALKTIKEYMLLNSKIGAKILGVHLEGPFISPTYIGAQPLQYVEKPTIEKFQELEKVSGNSIKIVTIAPEVEGALQLIKYFKNQGIVVSLGHTNASYEDVMKAISLGASCITHTFNAQKPLHHRDIGVAGSALLFDQLYCELIFDTIHVSVPAAKILLKNKPHYKIILITDAMRAKGMNDGNYELGGQKVIVKDATARLSNGVLAGSVLKLNEAIKNIINLTSTSIEQAIDMATINPAKNMGIDKERGSIKVGKYADLVVLSKTFEVLMTIREGNIIYKK